MSLGIARTADAEIAASRYFAHKLICVMIVPIRTRRRILRDIAAQGEDVFYTRCGKLVKAGALEYNTGDGTDICVYTSVDADTSKAADRYTVDYKGVTYAEIGVALSNMTLEPGAVIYIGLLRYQ